MTRRLPLHAIAHCRAGDKGDDSLLVLAPYEQGDFPRLRETVTCGLVAGHFAADAPGQVSVAALPSLCALVITVRRRLAGGVTRATGTDPHGKTLSGHLLSLVVDWS